MTEGTTTLFEALNSLKNTLLSKEKTAVQENNDTINDDINISINNVCTLNRNQKALLDFIIKKSRSDCAKKYGVSYSNEYLAKRIGVTERTIQRQFNYLIDSGDIHIRYNRHGSDITRRIFTGEGNTTGKDIFTRKQSIVVKNTKKVKVEKNLELCDNNIFPGEESNLSPIININNNFVGI